MANISNTPKKIAGFVSKWYFYLQNALEKFVFLKWQDMTKKIAGSVGIYNNNQLIETLNLL